MSDAPKNRIRCDLRGGSFVDGQYFWAPAKTGEEAAGSPWTRDVSRDNLFGASVIVTNPYDPTDRWDGVIISEPHYLRDGDIAYYNIQQTSGARIGYCGFFPTTHFVVK